MVGQPPTTQIDVRNTARKRHIREALEGDYADRPVLLEELRWAVRLRETGQQAIANWMVTRSWQNSFARTIREQFPTHRVHKIPVNGETPIGIVARAALYRLKHASDLYAFLQGATPCILGCWVTNIQPDPPRYRQRYATPHYYAARFRCFPTFPEEPSNLMIKNAPDVSIPGTHKLSLVVPPGTRVDLRPLANISWRLFGYRRANDWFEVRPADSLSKVERNPDHYGRI